jgi:hypothetical protein
LAPLAARLPAAAVRRAAALQRPGLPLYGPTSPLEGDATAIVDAAPLYAGQCVARIRRVEPAGDLTRSLAG